MALVELLFVLTSILLGFAGIGLVVLALRAYSKTSRRAMIHLSIGFTLIVAAALTTMVSALMTDFTSVRSILLVNNGITVMGYVFVMYSLVSYS